MRTFGDNATPPRTWNIEINTISRKSVKLATDGKVDLFAAVDGSLQESLSDPENVVMTLWALCQKQAESLKVDIESFARSLTGDTLETASERLMEAIADFSPSRQRKVLMKALARIPDLMEAAHQEQMKILDLPTDQLLTELKKRSTNLPASAESAPTNIPSVS